MSIKLEVDVDSFEKSMRRLARDVNRKVAGPAVEETAKDIVRDAKRITPVDTGMLRDSLTQETEVTAGGAEAGMGSDVEYSLIVHEDLNARHTNGQAKFLEKSLFRNPKQLVSNTRRFMRRLR